MEDLLLKIDMKDLMEEILFLVMKNGESVNGIKIMREQLQSFAFRVNHAQKTAYRADDNMTFFQLDKY